MEEKLTGIVLKNVPTGDSTSLITVLTVEKGRKLISCHGVRKLTAKNMPATQPFCFCEFIVTEKNGRLTLKESYLRESFFELRCDLVDCALGSYMLECAGECAREDEEEEELLQLLLNSLYALCKKTAPREILKAAFELRLLGEQGSGPIYDSCALCGKPLKDEFFFSPEEGGTVCKNCRENERFVTPPLPFDKSAQAAVAYVLNAPAKKLFSFRLTGKSARRFFTASEKSILSFFERNFESLKFYNTVKDDTSD